MALLIGLTIGTLLGLTGAGGSVFAVPLLILLLDLSPLSAMGLALAAVSASAAYGTFQQKHLILWAPAFVLAMTGALIAPIGKIISEHLSEGVLLTGFTALAISVATLMLRQATTEPEKSKHLRSSRPPLKEDSSPYCQLSSKPSQKVTPKCASALVLGGGLIGLTSGVFGVGGGFLIVPFLTYITSASFPAAVATSLFSITLVSGSGYASHLFLHGADQLDLTVKVIIGGTLGMVISQRVSTYISGKTLQQFFAVTLIFISLFTLFWTTLR